MTPPAPISNKPLLPRLAQCVLVGLLVTPALALAQNSDLTGAAAGLHDEDNDEFIQTELKATTVEE